MNNREEQNEEAIHDLRTPERPLDAERSFHFESSRPGENKGEEDRKSDFASIINTELSFLWKRNGDLHRGKWEFRFFRNYFSSTILVNKHKPEVWRMWNCLYKRTTFSSAFVLKDKSANTQAHIHTLTPTQEHSDHRKVNEKDFEIRHVGAMSHIPRNWLWPQFPWWLYIQLGIYFPLRITSIKRQGTKRNKAEALQRDQTGHKGCQNHSQTQAAT